MLSPSSRTTRNTLIAATGIAIVLSYALLSPFKRTHPFYFSNPLYRSTNPSSWLTDGGWLHYERGDEWGTKYDVLLRKPIKGISCDETREVGNGEMVCRSGIQAVRSLYMNSQAQKEHLMGKIRAAEPGDEVDFETTSEYLSGVAGKRILVIGDSLDRDWITQLVDLSETSSFYTNFDLSSYVPPQEPIPMRRGLLQSNLSSRAILMKHECGVAILPISPNPSLSSDAASLEAAFTPRYTADSPRPDHHFRIDYVFAFGLMNIGQSPNLPANTTHRLTALREIIGGDTSDKHDRGYDAITLNFGLWDLVGFMRRTFLTDLSDNKLGLTPEWIIEYIDTCQRFIESLYSTYGRHVPIYIRLVHDSAAGDFGLGLPANITAAGGRQAPFRLLREAQLRRAQVKVAERMNLKVLNFAGRFEGQGTSYTTDGVHPVTSANKVHAEMILRTLMSI